MSKLIKKCKYIRFYDLGIDDFDKHTYVIVNKNKDKLASIRYYGRWKCYCLFTVYDIIFDSICLNDIKNFLDDINNKLKK